MVHALLEAEEQVVVLDSLTTDFDWPVPPAFVLHSPRGRLLLRPPRWRNGQP
jgi:hypothetical protein